MSNKITKFISRIAGAVSKNEQTREFLTPATSEISRDTKNLLAGLFGKNDQKGENNQDNSKSDIKANHGIINVTHNNLSFVNNKLNPQAEKANSKPKVISFKSVTPLNNGPMDIEAADTSA